MSNVDRQMGARPVNIDGSPFNASTRPFSVDATTNSSTGIFPGDFVVQNSDGTISPASAGATNVILGVATSVMYDPEVAETEYPGYLPAGKDGVVYVAMAEDTYFSIQEDAADEADALDADDRGSRANFVAGAGSTQFGHSGHEINSTSVGTDATYQLQLVDKVYAPDNTYGPKAQWVVRVNLPQHTTSTAGI